jgi:hypothetical protein
MPVEKILITNRELLPLEDINRISLVNTRDITYSSKILEKELPVELKGATDAIIVQGNNALITSVLSFSKITNKYSKNNKEVSPLLVSKAEHNLKKRTNNRVEALVDDLVINRMRLDKWEQSLAEELKQLHIQRALLTRGGKNASTQSDWSAIGLFLKEEFRFIHNMALDIQQGDVTEAGLRARLKLYIEKSSLASHFMRKENATDSGFKYMRRILGDSDNHCSECLIYERLGVLPIGQLALPTTACTCGANCKCTVIYLFENELTSSPD